MVFTAKSQPRCPAADATRLSGGGNAAAAGTPAPRTTAPLHLKAAGNLQRWTICLHGPASPQKQSPEGSLADSTAGDWCCGNLSTKMHKRLVPSNTEKKAFTRIKEKKGGKNFQAYLSILKQKTANHYDPTLQAMGSPSISQWMSPVGQQLVAQLVLATGFWLL